MTRGRFSLGLGALFATACATIPAPPPPPAHAAYAWAVFDAGGVTRLGAAGLADPATARALTIDDPARIASVSKLVVALGALRMAEAGTLDLDRDVGDYLGWRARNPAFPDAPISLRQLLSHRSGLRDDVDYAIPLGGTIRAALADPRAFDAAHPPGAFFRYANLNFPVIAAVMEKASGERFDALMDRLVIEPLELDACFNWAACGDARIAQALVLTGADGAVLRDDLKGRRPACPVVPAADGSCDLSTWRPGENGALFSPQGGLRISVRDLAAIGAMLLRNGRDARGRVFLSTASLAALEAGQWRSNGGANGESESGFYCGYGLALQILGHCPPGDSLFGEGRAMIGHAGDAYGLRSGLWIDRERRSGIAYLATGIAEDAPRGKSAYRAIEEWLAAKLGK